MKNIIYFATMIFLSNSLAMAEDTNPVLCGNSKAVVFDGDLHKNRNFTIKVTGSDFEGEYKYQLQNEYLGLTCEVASDGRALFIVAHYCGGSGCTEKNYGIIDSSNGKILLSPTERYKGNEDKLLEVLGRSIAPISCSEKKPNQVCIRSKVELG